MNPIQTDENSFLNFPIVFEKVGPTISKRFSSMHVCAWDDIVPLTSFWYMNLLLILITLYTFVLIVLSDGYFGFGFCDT